MKHTKYCIHYTIVLMKFVIRIFLYLNFLYTLGTLFVFSVPRLYEDHQVFIFSIHPSREYITFIGPKKIPVVLVPRFPTDPIIFSTRLTVRPYFLWVVVGCSYSVPK